MKSKISDMLTNDEKISLGKIAKELGISMLEVLREAPTVRKYDVERIDELFNTLRE